MEIDALYKDQFMVFNQAMAGKGTEHQLTSAVQGSTDVIMQGKISHLRTIPTLAFGLGDIKQFSAGKKLGL